MSATRGGFLSVLTNNDVEQKPIAICTEHDTTTFDKHKGPFILLKT